MALRGDTGRRHSMWPRCAAVILLTCTLAPATAPAKPTPEEKCQAAKNLAAGKYALCRQKAEQKLALTGDTAKHAAALAACTTKLEAAWQKAGEAAAQDGATCTDAALSVEQFAAAVDGLTEHVASALAGSGLPAVCDNSCRGRADGTTCDAGLNFTATRICVAGECVACRAAAGVTPQFVDNGDGTITQRGTCLVWEKKHLSGMPFVDPHYWGNTWKWSLCDYVNDPVCPPNGTVFTRHLADLNTAQFAGHNDWRLPTGQQLATLIDLDACAGGGPCIAPAFAANCFSFECTIDGAGGTEICSCTVSGSYWASDDIPTNNASMVTFVFGYLSSDRKDAFHHVRAVRGVPFTP